MQKTSTSHPKLSLNDLLERLCPQLRRQHWLATIRGSGGQAIIPELHEADIRSTIARLEAQAGSTKTYGHALKMVEAEAIRDAKKASQQEAATIAAKLQLVLSDALRDEARFRFIAVGEDGKEQDIPPRSADRCRWNWGLGFAVLSPAAPGGRETILHDVTAVETLVERVEAADTQPEDDADEAAPLPPELVERYRAYVADHDPKLPPPRREEDERALAKAFPAMKGMRALSRRVRAQEAPETWTSDGPKGRKKRAHEADAAKNLGHDQVAKLP
jgi:hypothetical protein